MTGACIYSDDIIVIARAITAANNRIVVTRIDEEFTLKRLQRSARRMNFRARDHSCLLSKVHSDTASQGIVVTKSMLPNVKANLFMHKKHYPKDIRLKGD